MPFGGSRDFFIFADAGPKLDRIAVVRYSDERVKSHYEMISVSRDRLAETLQATVAKYSPKTIGLNMTGIREPGILVKSRDGERLRAGERDYFTRCGAR